MTHVSSLYLHVPFCKHLCNYCDFYKQKLTSHREQFDGFHQFLKEGWLKHEQFLIQHGHTWSALETLYFGGGTPSLWGIDGAKFWHDFFPLKLAADCEFTMEVDPGTWTPEVLEAWKKLGLNRISMGTQSLAPEFLKIMDRVHDVDESYALLEYCSQGDWNFSMDFLLGIPYSASKNRNIISELQDLIRYKPKHVSLYILNARSKYPHISEIPLDDYIREEYLKVSEFLCGHGFHHYEVSNFALPGFESKHNLKYWRSDSVAALGPTGTGLLRLSEEQALRYKWKVSHPAMELEPLNSSELDLEKTYLTLRTSAGWQVPVNPAVLRVIEAWENRGYGSYQSGKMRLNSLGFLMLDSLMDDLFRAGV